MRPRSWASDDDHDEAHQAHPEQVIRKLRDADRMLAEQKSIAEIAKELQALDIGGLKEIARGNF
jgi:hypothetical protein